MQASPLQAIRISVVHLASACHFWESAFGYQFVRETQVEDPALRSVWEVEGGSLHVARLERRGEPYARLELYQWENCTGEPARDPHRPWDPGVRELQFHVDDLSKSRAHLERLRCHFPNGDSVFMTPFGERCRLVTNGTAAASVALTVPSLEEAQAFFQDGLGWTCKELTGATDAASISSAARLLCASNGSGFGRIEASEYRRLADPRAPIDRSPRMSPRYTGVWMLTTSTSRLPEGDRRIIDCDVPFVGRTRAIVSRAPGGVRFGVFEAI